MARLRLGRSRGSILKLLLSLLLINQFIHDVKHSYVIFREVQSNISLKEQIMKLNLLASLTLLVIGNFVSGVEAETIKQSNCGWVKDCTIETDKMEVANQANKMEVVTPLTPSLSSEKVETLIQLPEAIVQLPDKKASTVADLTAKPQGNAAILKSSNNVISQIITPPTDSSGNPIFRATRSGPSYFGVGANFGISGNSDLGGTSFAVISKLGLTDVISARPSVLILRNFATILLPATYDFPIQQPFADFRFSPYLGGGLAINTGSNSSIGPMITGGVDIPLSSVFTINVAANLAFLRTTDLGILVGLGLNF